MTIKKAAGSQPAAGSTDAQISLSTQSTKANMTSASKNPAAETFLDFALLSKTTVNLARQLGMELIAFTDSFGAYKDGDTISGCCSPSGLEQWLSGYLNGKDDPLIVEQIEQVKPLLDELMKAEIVVQVLLAQMPDKKRVAAADALHAAGFSLGDPMRHKARQAVISAANSAMIAASISGTPV